MRKFPRIALVGILTHETFEYLKHNNLNPKAYSALDAWSPNDDEFALAFDYIRNDKTLDPELQIIVKQSNSIDEIGAQITNNREFVRQLIKSFHNFYYTYTLENINDGVAVLPYPLLSDRQIDFDYYVVLNQEYDKIYQSLKEEGYNVFEDVNFVEGFRRVNEVISQLPKDDTVVTIDIPWTPHGDEPVSTPPEVIKKLCNICAEFYSKFVNAQSNV